MPRPSGPVGPRPGRLLGLYALAVMDREGPIYGYSFAERVADRTDGSWRPGAGAVYPAFQRLVDRGYARAVVDGRRRVYRITAPGRAFLHRVRAGWMAGSRSGPDLSRLWSEVAGESDLGAHLATHLHRHLEQVASLLERAPDTPAGRGSLLARVRTELAAAQSRLDAVTTGSRGGRGRARRVR